ncbi:MAG: GNAT family N-acetyltransferase [Promethearchaeota archaeon]
MPKPKSEDWFNQIRKNIRDTFQNITAEILDVFEERPSYVQMRLPVDKITQEFEESLKEKIEQGVLQAEIRKATEQDIEKVYNIYSKAWQSTSMPFREVSQDTFLKFQKQFNTIFLVARVESIDSGFILIHFEGKNNEIGVINGFGVLPQFQHKGLGITLAMAAWNYFKERGVRELRCEVHKDNKIPYAFIKSLGFEEML